MSNKKKTFVPRYKDWTPPQAMWDALKEEGLKGRDRVEVASAFFSLAHGGAYAYASEIAEILGVTKPYVEKMFKELIDQKRAKQIDGRFVLTNSVYSHPITREYMPEND